MTIRLDLRTRTDDDRVISTPADLADRVLPALLEGPNGTLAAQGAGVLGLEPLAVDIEGRVVTLRPAGDRIELLAGDADAPNSYEITARALSRALTDQCTFGSAIAEGSANPRRGDPTSLFRWDPVVQALLNGWKVYEPGDVTFVDRDGGPLDLDTVFPADADPAEMAHFLEQAGFLHVRGVYTPAEVARLQAAWDDVFARAEHWGPDLAKKERLANDEWRVVRVPDLASHWPALSDYLAKPEFVNIAAGLDDGKRVTPTSGDAQHKAIDVVQGISNTPWHRDCALGNHSYRCPVVKAGIAVTGSDEASGMFGVIPGSHRVNVLPLPTEIPAELPRKMIRCEPGDVHVHLTCTFHRGTAPTSAERRVLYAMFLLEGSSDVSPYADNGEDRRLRVGAAVAFSTLLDA